MFDLGIPIFPFTSTAITVTTTVWIGVLVAVFFNLRLGWTLSGLVVPGYLVPLLLTRPITAGVILFEAILTYGIVKLISESPRKLPYWSSFFGRDRFFVILLVSVLVRAILDGWALPFIGRIAVEEYGFNFDYRNNLHSFGLIVVALIANYFWKPGVRRGILPLITCVGVTYFIINYLVVGVTNFNIGNFNLLYEDISTSLMASPKAYIIVLMTAYIASWINLRYAWDFNGILIPALLGLLWYDPSKILVTGIECVLLFFMGSYLLKAPVFQRTTMEGGRKLIFFFTVCFIYRLVLCHAWPFVMPGMEVSDSFGFGYLLSTLLAIKAHDKKLSFRMVRATAEVSILGAVVGSLIGFAFFCGPRIQFYFDVKNTNVASQNAPDLVTYSTENISELVRIDKILLYEKQKSESYVPPVVNELSIFRNAIEQIKLLPSELPPRSLEEIARQLRNINYELVVSKHRYLYLRETSPANGWGLYVVDKQHPNGLCLQIPAPLDEWATVESGLCLFENIHCSALGIAGTPRRINASTAADVTKSRDSIFNVFHEAFADHVPFQIRGNNSRTLGQIAGMRANPQTGFRSAGGLSQLWIRGTIPSHLRLKRLKQLTGKLEICWNNSPLPNRLRDHTSGDFLELILNHEDRRKLIGQLFVGPNHSAAENAATSMVKVQHNSLRDWMGIQKERIARQGTNEYLPAKLEQMSYLDHEVFTPLIQLMQQIKPTTNGPESQTPGWLTEQVAAYLVPIDVAAKALGYELTVIYDTQINESYVALSEIESETRRCWGTFVFRPGMIEDFAVEIPRPLFELRSFDFGVNLFSRPRASVLLVAGAHPRANLDGTADISMGSNKTNLFNLVRHVLLRQLEQRPFLITQARAIQAPVDADIVLATDDGTNIAEDLTPLKQRLHNQLQSDQLSVAFVNGRQETAGYELGILMQATTIQVSQNKEVVSLWLSPSLRTKFREQSENNALAAQFEACDIPLIEQDLIDYLSGYSSTLESVQPPQIPMALKNGLNEYANTFDVVKLYSTTKKYADWEFRRLVDHSSGQVFLIIEQENHLAGVLNLTGFVSQNTMRLDKFDANQIESFVRSRALWLRPSAEKHHQKFSLGVPAQ